MATTRDYKVVPSATGGISLASNISAWAYSSYATVISYLPQGGFITGITFCPDVTDASLAVDTLCEVLVELYKGGSDTLIAQIPISYKIDDRTTHVQPRYIALSEPLAIEGGVQIRCRIADSVAAVMDAQNSIKVHYYLNNPPTVALNTPTDGATGVSTTPNLLFTGTDPESPADEVEYNAQVDTVNTFDSSTAVISTIANISAVGGSGAITSGSIDTTGANFIIISISRNLGTSGALSDSHGNTWTPLTIRTNTVSENVLFYSYPTNVGANHTFSIAGASNFVTMQIQAFKNVGTFDVENGATVSGTSLQTGSVSPAVNGSLIISGLSFNGLGLPVSIDSSFTKSNDQDFLTSNNYGGAAAYLIQTTASAVNPTWTRTNSNQTSASIAVFRPLKVPPINKLSVTPDATFAGTGDPHPWPSGNQVTYTVQAGDVLANNTLYYWRVRGKDPVGSNTSGAWSSTRSFTTAPATSATLTGTSVPTQTEADIVTGGKTIIITLTGDTWVSAGATFDAQRQNIINGLDSAQAEANGWDAKVKALEVVTAVVRTSDTIVTVTLTASATYDITATETITCIIPSTALVGAVAITASPTFTVTVVSGAVSSPYLMMMGCGS